MSSQIRPINGVTPFDTTDSGSSSVDDGASGQTYQGIEIYEDIIIEAIEFVHPNYAEKYAQVVGTNWVFPKEIGYFPLPDFKSITLAQGVGHLYHKK